MLTLYLFFIIVSIFEERIAALEMLASFGDSGRAVSSWRGVLL